MTDSTPSFDVDEASFHEAVINRSYQTPVLVDFWADWCGPCKALEPVLHEVVESLGGQVQLAKVNADEQQALAQAFGVRSLPTVKLFRKGAVVDEFMGVQPESAIRAMLDPHLERVSDQLCAQAVEAREAGELDLAVKLLNQAVGDDPGNPRLYPELLEVCLERDDLEAANAILAALPDGVDEDRINELRARVRLANQSSGGTADEQDVRERVEQAPKDCALRIELATLLASQSRHEEALEELLEAVRIDRAFDDGAARKAMLDIFALLGNSGPVVSRYRSQLANTLN
ncbi:MAG: thioredoxin [Thiotrichales bacterium]|nr:thioredoxin [Thiotrichales bacterium]